ncbi:hypothetical protein ABZX40_38265 [Streptomyces sp. NPDC004610]|uniref:hypothetical protein n=1 Tax=unclassified Streptomyces TaxID=2593676 RepID=UPI0033B4D2CC
MMTTTQRLLDLAVAARETSAILDRTGGSAVTSHHEPRLAGSAEIAAEQGLSPARISGLYGQRAENGFPGAVATLGRGRARLWDHAEVSEWFANRPRARLRNHSPPPLDPDDLLNAADASRFL